MRGSLARVGGAAISWPDMRRGAIVVGLVLVACAPREAEVPVPRYESPAAESKAAVETVVVGPGRAQGVAAGLVHSCVVVAGAVHCWGYNGHGELGDGTRVDRRTPAPVVGIADAVQVVAGGWHSCALRSDGTVMCWGDAGEGQVGDGATGTRLAPVAVKGLSGITELAAGTSHTCAIGQAGAVWCWGMNVFGEVDAQGPEARTVPVRVKGVTASAIAAGSNYSCAVSAGRVRCWGQVPLPDLADGKVAEKTGGVVTVPEVQGAVEVAAGDRHACARVNDGRVLCWGRGREGQRGDGVVDELPPRWRGPHPPPWRPPPRGVVEVGGVRDAAQLSAGSDSTCVRTTEGAVLCWGAGRDGQLGDGGTTAQARAVAAKIEGVVDLSVGSAHACALRGDGNAWCWGYNEYGQADNRGVAQDFAAVRAVGAKASAVAVGGGHVCALGEGRVWCVGENPYGQLGDGTRVSRDRPVTIAGIRDAVQVVAGERHTCVVREGGAVQCWGDDTFGQMGQRGLPSGEPYDEHSGPLPLAPIEARSSAVAMTPLGLGAVKLLATHEHRTCALQVDGGVACWHDWAEVPVKVEARLPGAKALALGAVHTCVVVADGGVKCWGKNFYGRIGDGTRIDRDQPTTVIGLRGPAVAVAAGRLHTCALLQDGGVACWGTGFAGRLGDGDEEERAAPVMVKGLSDAVAIAAGYEYSCAVRRGGEAVCWGDNSNGVLGDGTRGSRSVPVKVKGVTAVTMVAGGEASTCAVGQTGAVACWGKALREVAGPQGDGPGWSIARVPVAVRRGAPGSQITGLPAEAVQQ